MKEPFYRSSGFRYFVISTTLVLGIIAAYLLGIKPSNLKQLGSGIGFSGIVVESYDGKTPIPEAEMGVYSLAWPHSDMSVSIDPKDGAYRAFLNFWFHKRLDIVWASAPKHITKSMLFFGEDIYGLGGNTKVDFMMDTISPDSQNELVVKVMSQSNNGPYTIELEGETSPPVNNVRQGIPTALPIDMMSRGDHTLVITDNANNKTPFEFSLDSISWSGLNSISTTVTVR